MLWLLIDTAPECEGSVTTMVVRAPSEDKREVGRVRALGAEHVDRRGAVVRSGALYVSAAVYRWAT